MIYSHSRLSTFEQCRLKFKFAYIDRIKRDTDSIEAFLGSRFHEVMEKVYEERAFWTPTAADLVQYFDELWDKNWNDDVFLSKKNRTPDDYRKIGHKALVDYHHRHAPFDLGRVLGIEKKITADLDGTGKYRIMGYIDRLMEIEDGHFEIHDYKTGGHLPEQEKLDSDRQLALYEIAIRALWPHDVKTVDLVWHYVVFDKELRSARTANQLDELKQSTITLINEVEKADEYPPTESNLCRWCSYEDICPLFAHKAKTETLPVNEYLKEEGVTLVNAYATLDAKKRALTAETKTIEDEQAKIVEAAIHVASQQGVTILYGSDKVLKIGDDIKVTYPKKDDDNWTAFESGLKALRLWEGMIGFNWSALKSEAKKQGWAKAVPGPLSTCVKVDPVKTVRLSKRKDLEEE